MNRRQRRICERLGWNVTEFKNEVELSQYSPAGEDFSFTANKKNFARSVQEYAEEFVADEHAEMWVENMHTVKGVPQSIRTLIDDADAIKEMLTELSEQINNHKRSLKNYGKRI